MSFDLFPYVAVIVLAVITLGIITYVVGYIHGTFNTVERLTRRKSKRAK